MAFQSISLLSYFLGFILVVYAELFGHIGYISPVSVAGMIIILTMGLLLAFIKICPFTVNVTKNTNTFSKLSLVISGFVSIYLFMIVNYYGLPASFYIFTGELPPADILNGKYRELLPLRAFIPNIVLVNAISIFLIRNNIRNKKWLFIAKGISVVVLILLAAIYETRHVFFWFFIYLLQAHFYTIKQLKNFISSRRILYAGLMFCLLFFLFAFIGNYRSGITTEASEQFALAMAVNSDYAQYNIFVIWGIIYAFSGIARGVANASQIAVITFSPDKDILPGVLQFLVEERDVSHEIYSEQHFAIDGWHTLCQEFGFLGGAFIFLGLMFIFIYSVSLINKRLKKNKIVCGAFFAFFLWLCVRIILLPIGNYLTPFSAFVELLLLTIFFNMAGFQLKRSNSSSTL